MKKKLEAELISIAHRILQIKQKSDIITLHQEVQKLYETLSVLRFIEDNFSEAKPTIGVDVVKQKIEDNLDNIINVEQVSEENEIQDQDSQDKLEEPISENDDSKIDSISDMDDEEEIDHEELAIDEEHTALEEQLDDAEDQEENTFYKENEDEKEVLASTDEDTDEVEVDENVDEELQSEEINHSAIVEEEIVEESEEKSVFIPSFELAFDPKPTEEETPISTPAPQFTFDDLLGKGYTDPVFVKAEEAESESVIEEVKLTSYPSTSETVYDNSFEKEKKTFSVNDRLSKGITIGLNDRIAFMKHLFGNSSEDYNRVLSQLITFDTFEEAEAFIADMVKPDYNNWAGKDEYSQRFMEIVERRFS